LALDAALLSFEKPSAACLLMLAEEAMRSCLRSIPSEPPVVVEAHPVNSIALTVPISATARRKILIDLTHW
jgi:hypothetical protein